MKEKIGSIVSSQMEANRANNLLYKDLANHLNVAEETRDLIDNKLMLIQHFFKHCTIEEYEELIAETSIKAIDHFLRINQFLNFDHASQKILKDIYQQFFKGIQEETLNHNLDLARLKELMEDHHRLLGWFLIQTNGEEIFKKDMEHPYCEEIICEEYSAESQIKLLGLVELVEPVLDIGCGRHAYLVEYLKKRGIEAYGIDRLINQDWFEFDIVPHSWGTIISNMAFSNHFYHHHIRKDGNPITYAMKYREILEGLVIGGSFIYAPSLPFIEDCLDERFRVERQRVDGWILDERYQVVRITRNGDV